MNELQLSAKPNIYAQLRHSFNKEIIYFKFREEFLYSDRLFT